VPANWGRVAYASLKSLGSWYADLHLRVAFIRRWMTKGHPKAYWLSGLFFPHGFLTGVLQTYARKHEKAIDFLKFRYAFLDDLETPKGAQTELPELDLLARKPDDGAVIFGLHIESAAWDAQAHCLREQKPG